MSRNCFGTEVLLAGQKRLPMPPAMMAAYVCGLFIAAKIHKTTYQRNKIKLALPIYR